MRFFSIKRFPIYYGFVIMLCAIGATLISTPGQTIGFSAFTDYMIRSLDISRVQLSTTYMIGTFTSSFLIISVGMAIDRYGARIIATLASALLGGTLIFLCQLIPINHYLNARFANHTRILLMSIILCFAFAMLRLLGQGTVKLVSNALIAKWFVGLRGRVISVVGVFTTFAYALSPPFFNKMIQEYSWSGTYCRIGFIILIIFPLFFLIFIRNTPESVGMTPDSNTTKHVNAHKNEHSWTLKEARRTYTFWVFNAALAMQAFLTSAVAFNITNIFIRSGLTRHDAMQVFLYSACVALVVKINSGYLIDVSGLKNKLHWQCIVMLSALMLSCVGLLGLPHTWSYLLYIICSGIATGLFVTFSGVVWPQYFGRRYVGSLFGFNKAVLVFTSAVGPITFALLLQYTHSYTVALAISILFILLTITSAFRAKKPPYLKKSVH